MLVLLLWYLLLFITVCYPQDIRTDTGLSSTIDDTIGSHQDIIGTSAGAVDPDHTPPTHHPPNAIHHTPPIHHQDNIDISAGAVDLEIGTSSEEFYGAIHDEELVAIPVESLAHTHTHSQHHTHTHTHTHTPSTPASDAEEGDVGMGIEDHTHTPTHHYTQADKHTHIPSTQTSAAESEGGGVDVVMGIEHHEDHTHTPQYEGGVRGGLEGEIVGDGANVGQENTHAHTHTHSDPHANTQTHTHTHTPNDATHIHAHTHTSDADTHAHTSRGGTGDDHTHTQHVTGHDADAESVSLCMCMVYVHECVCHT